MILIFGLKFYFEINSENSFVSYKDNKSDDNKRNKENEKKKYKIKHK